MLAVPLVKSVFTSLLAEPFDVSLGLLLFVKKLNVEVVEGELPEVGLKPPNAANGLKVGPFWKRK
jgi:hypothetical protein